MGQTPLGFPYPEPTDPVADGAAAIESLAEAAAAGDRGGAWTATQHVGIQQAAVALNSSRVDWVQTAGRRYLVLASCWFSKAAADVSSQVVMQILRGDTSGAIANVRSYCIANGDVTISAQGVINATTSQPTFVQLYALTGAGFVN